MENLIESYRGYLKVLAESTLPRKLRLKIDSSDLVQTTMVKALASKSELRDSDPNVVRAWLRVVLANTLADACRHFATEKRDIGREQDFHAQVDQSHLELEGWLAADQTSPSMAAVRREDLTQLFDAISKLPDTVREVILLKHVHNKSLNEIAEQTDRTIAAVAGSLRRGLAKLREILD